MKYTLLRSIFILTICYGCKRTYEPPVNNWTGFQPPFSLSNTGGDYVILRDINNDTYPDVITAYIFTRNANNFSIHLNDGTGHFLNEALIPIGNGYMVWDMADLTNDGWADILTSYYWDNGIRLYTGQGLTTFSEGPLMPTGVHGWLSKIYDIDGDGKLDLISISNGSGNPIRLHIFKGKGDGTFFPKVTYESVYSTARSLNIADINQDSLPDIILAASFNKIPIFIQQKDHSFTSTEIPVERGECFGNAVGDINNDGILDVVYGGDFPPENRTDTIRIVLGKGNGLFRPSYTTASLSSVKTPIYVRLADINQDRNLDIITFDKNTKDLYYFLGNGDGSFADPQKLTSNDTIHNFEVGDINKDGFPDIITVNQGSTISVFTNKGR
ncbi:MAG TPA: VCBS repeat-containing protein [Bacteroidales bacterium]